MNNAASIRQFLQGVYGARGPEGELVFDPEKGVLVENLGKVGESRILNGEVSGRVPVLRKRDVLRRRGRRSERVY